jgi:hypothetical protein
MNDIKEAQPDPPLDQEQEDLRRLKSACLFVLAGQFDAVQIVATRHDGENGTTYASWGEGNVFSRTGSVRDWLRKAER